MVKCDVKKKPVNFSQVEKEQPKPLFSLLPMNIQQTPEEHQVRSQDSLKSTTVQSLPSDGAGMNSSVYFYALS